MVSIDFLYSLTKLRLAKDLRAPNQPALPGDSIYDTQFDSKGHTMAIVAKPGPLQPPPRIAPREDLNPYRIAQIQFDIAAEHLKLDPGMRQVLRSPKRILEVSIPTKMDNGQVKVFTGFRVQHSTARGPAKGGIRFHPRSRSTRSRRWPPG